MSNNFFDREGFDYSMDVSASNRKFQTSIVVKQDPNKSGILSLLKNVEQSSQVENTSTTQTQRVSREYNQ